MLKMNYPFLLFHFSFSFTCVSSPTFKIRAYLLDKVFSPHSQHVFLSSMSDKLCKSYPEVICIIEVNLHKDINWISEQLGVNPSSGM